MSTSHHIAIDLGASSGRVALGRLSAGRLSYDILHRFPNGPVGVPGAAGTGLYWDILGLWREILHGLRLAGDRARAEGLAVSSVGVAGWGVDYALLDEQGLLLDGPRHYRDPRTDAVYPEVVERLGRENIYGQTGVQFMPINTLYQLEALRRGSPQVLRSARRLLMVPDLLHFWLSGRAACEITNASTTQMYNPVSRSWAEITAPYRALLPELIEPGTRLGALRPQIADETGLQGVQVVAPATHDTASAVAATPAFSQDWAYVSSGTWSLVGVETDGPLISAEALSANLTNEAGAHRTTRLLKNVMGLWILQECRHSWGDPDWAQLYRGAEETRVESWIDPDAPLFLHTGHDMPQRVQQFCQQTGQAVPQTQAEIARCVLESLALKYRHVLGQIARLSGGAVRTLHIIGGGSQIGLLNRLTADVTGLEVVAGPVEATLMGNLLVQAEGAGLLEPAERRGVVARSSQLERFPPGGAGDWGPALERFGRLVGR